MLRLLGKFRGIPDIVCFHKDILLMPNGILLLASREVIIVYMHTYITSLPLLLLNSHFSFDMHGKSFVEDGEQVVVQVATNLFPAKRESTQRRKPKKTTESPNLNKDNDHHFHCYYYCCCCIVLREEP